MDLLLILGSWFQAFRLGLALWLSGFELYHWLSWVSSLHKADGEISQPS